MIDFSSYLTFECLEDSLTDGVTLIDRIASTSTSTPFRDILELCSESYYSFCNVFSMISFSFSEACLALLIYSSGTFFTDFSLATSFYKCSLAETIKGAFADGSLSAFYDYLTDFFGEKEPLAEGSIASLGIMVLSGLITIIFIDFYVCALASA